MSARHIQSVIALAAVALSLSAATVRAADTAASAPAQLGSCASGAAGKQGAELKAYLQACVGAKAKVGEEKLKTAEARREACLPLAQGKTGAARVEFMASCMKAGASAPAAATAVTAPASAASN